MADGIKIRALNLTTTVKREDVLIVDKLNTINNENITYQISVNDFTQAIIANPDNTVGNLSDVVINNPQNGEVLTYDGDTWVNLPSAGGTSEAVVFNSTATPVLFAVTVGNRTEANRFNQDATSSNVFYIDEIEAPSMILAPGIRYRFDQSDSSNTGYNLRLYTTPSNVGLINEPYSNEVLGDVNIVGTPGQDGAYTELFITQKYEGDSLQGVVLVTETLLKLFYNCEPTSGSDNFMGNSILNSGHIEGTDFDLGDIGGVFPMMQSNIGTLQSKVQSLETIVSRLIEVE